MVNLAFLKRTNLFHLWIFFFLIGAIIRVTAIGAVQLWGDEFHLVKFSTQSNLAEFFTDYISGENDSQPLHYLISFFFFKLVHLSRLFVRLPALLFGLMSMPLLYFVTKKYFGEEIALSCVVLLSFNFFHIRYSIEARPYSLFIFLSIVSVYYFLKFSVDRQLLSDRIKLSVTNILMYFTHPFAIFFILLQYIAFVIKNLPLIGKVKEGQVSLMNALFRSFMPELVIFPALFLLRIRVFMGHSGIPTESFFRALFELYREYLQYSYFQKYNNFVLIILLLFFLFRIFFKNRSFVKLRMFYQTHRYFLWFLLLSVFLMPSLLYWVPKIRIFYVPRLFAFILVPLLLIVSFMLELLNKAVKYIFFLVLILFSINSTFYRLDFNRSPDLNYDLLFDKLRVFDKKVVLIHVNAKGVINFYLSQNNHSYSNVITQEIFFSNFKKLNFETNHSNYVFIYHLNEIPNMRIPEILKDFLPNVKYTFIDADTYSDLPEFKIKKAIPDKIN